MKLKQNFQGVGGGGGGGVNSKKNLLPREVLRKDTLLHHGNIQSAQHGKCAHKFSENVSVTQAISEKEI